MVGGFISNGQCKLDLIKPPLLLDAYTVPGFGAFDVPVSFTSAKVIDGDAQIQQTN